MLGTRVIVGVVLALLALVVTIHGGLFFFVVALGVAVVGTNEFYRMMRPYRPLVLAGFVGVVLMAYFGWTHSPQTLMGVVALTLLLSFGLAALPGPRPGVSVRIAITMLGLVYVGFGVGHLELIRRLPEGQGYALMVVFGAWAGDTIAYFTGRFFGATPMAPRLSPKKTWEGFVGGFIGTVLMVVFIGLYYHAHRRAALAAAGHHDRRGRSARRPLRVAAQARRRDQRRRPLLSRARRPARPLRRPAVRRRGELLPHPRPALGARRSHACLSGDNGFLSTDQARSEATHA